jgi:adenylate cyclase
MFEGNLLIANVGDTEIVSCNNGKAVLLTRRHDMHDKDEIYRVRQAGGFLHPNQTLNNTISYTRGLISLLTLSFSLLATLSSLSGLIPPSSSLFFLFFSFPAFGHFNLLPAINAAPYIDEMKLQATDEFLIIASSTFWEIISYQTAVDIARTEISHPSRAAHRLRNYALACGANNALTVMVISCSKTLPVVAHPKGR